MYSLLCSVVWAWGRNVGVVNILVMVTASRNTMLGFSFLPFSDGCGIRHCSWRVQSEGVKNESKGLQETSLPARLLHTRAIVAV